MRHLLQLHQKHKQTNKQGVKHNMMKYSYSFVSILAGLSPVASAANGLRKHPNRKLPDGNGNDKSFSGDSEENQGDDGDISGIFFDDEDFPNPLYGTALTATFLEFQSCVDGGFTRYDQARLASLLDQSQRISDDDDVESFRISCFLPQPVAPTPFAGADIPNRCFPDNGGCISGLKQTACYQVGGLGFGYNFVYTTNISWDWSDWTRGFPCAKINPTIHGALVSRNGECSETQESQLFRNEIIITPPGVDGMYNQDFTGTILNGGTFCQQYWNEHYIFSNLLEYTFFIHIQDKQYLGTFTQVFPLNSMSTIPPTGNIPTITLQEVDLSPQAP